MNWNEFKDRHLSHINNWNIASEDTTSRCFNKLVVTMCYDSLSQTVDYMIIYLPDGEHSFGDSGDKYIDAKNACMYYDQHLSNSEGTTIILNNKEIDIMWPKLLPLFKLKSKVIKEDNRFLRVVKGPLLDESI